MFSLGPPEYQRTLVLPRISAGLADLAIVAVIYVIFLVTTYMEMPENFVPDRRLLNLRPVLFLSRHDLSVLFMLSASRLRHEIPRLAAVGLMTRRSIQSARVYAASDT